MRHFATSATRMVNGDTTENCDDSESDDDKSGNLIALKTIENAFEASLDSNQFKIGYLIIRTRMFLDQY